MNQTVYQMNPFSERRPTIGLAIANIFRPWELLQWKGVLDAAEKMDANLVCFLGEGLKSPHGYDAQANILYRLCGSECVDGLIVWTGGLDESGVQEEMVAFCEQYRGIPVVCAEDVISGFPSITLDNYQAMRAAIKHMIEVHQYRRIAYMNILPGHFGLHERYRAYEETLAEYNLPLDASLVYDVPVVTYRDPFQFGQWLHAKGLGDMQAIVGCNDRILLNALPALKEAGKTIPFDVALVGMDNTEEGQMFTPALTSVRPPFYEIGQAAVETVLAMLSGVSVPEETIIPSQLVVRQSCGCASAATAKAGLKPHEESGKPFTIAFAERKAAILAEVGNLIGENPDALLEQAGRLVDAVAADLSGEPAAPQPNTFLAALNQTLTRLASSPRAIAFWQDFISALRQHTWACLANDPARLSYANDLWQQARLSIAEIEQQILQYQRLLETRRNQEFNAVAQALITSSSLNRLTKIMAERLPGLGLPSFYISLYEDPGEPEKTSRLLLACTDQERLPIPDEGIVFPTMQLVPADFLPENRRYSLVAEALYFQEQQIGLALFEVGTREAAIYNTLRGLLSSALQVSLLVQNAEHRSVQLQTSAEVAHAAGSILDPDELIREMVELIRSRFNLYYAGLFLIDEEKEFAVLRSGTGEAGQKMMESGHRLALDDSSMIGWCIIHQQARTALDIGAEAVHFNNPYLPATRSEMALPLISRGEAIGALTIQSARPKAFGEEDVNILLSTAAQLANAISNARLFEQTQATLREMEATYRRYLKQAWGDFARTRKTMGYRRSRGGMVPVEIALPPEARQAIQQQRAVVHTETDGEGNTALIVPIVLRGQPLGFIRLSDEGSNRRWSARDITLVQSLSERLALAAENIRLIDETQRRAEREHMVSSITTKLRSTNDPQAILQIAASELRQALRAKNAQVVVPSLQANPQPEPAEAHPSAPEPEKEPRGDV